jgi:hypothetical protein
MEDDPNTKNGTMENIGCMYQEVQVPAHQGFFVYQDGKGDKLRLVKETFLDEDGIGTDLLNWNYSGKPPGAGPKRSRALEDSDAAGKRVVTSIQVNVINPKLISSQLWLQNLLVGDLQHLSL